LETADRECDSMHDYGGGTAQAAATVPASRVIKDFGKMGRRKIHT
jgi:hypothetical protein